MAPLHLDSVRHIILITFLLITLLAGPSNGLWLFQAEGQAGEQGPSTGEQQVVQQEAGATKTALNPQPSAGFLAQRLSGYGTRLLSIAGIQPASIASLLNTVSDTGFRYFNIQDQCRNRAACDLGFMLFKRLSFVHNWLIRSSVRTLTDMNNIYTQSWMEGMLGRNCTAVYAACRESPLEGLMNLAMLQQLAVSSGVAGGQASAAGLPTSGSSVVGTATQTQA